MRGLDEGSLEFRLVVVADEGLGRPINRHDIAVQHPVEMICGRGTQYPDYYYNNNND